MSSRFGQFDGSLPLPDEPKKTGLLADGLSGTSFFAASGRVYRLFGTEEEQVSLPDIPPIPSILTAPKSSALSLEDALQQIEQFTSQTPQAKPQSAGAHESVQTIERVPPVTDSPTLQLFQALSDSAAPRLLKKERSAPNISVSAQLVVPQTFRLVPEPVEEPLIVPFVQPEPVPESVPESPGMETITLKIVAEPPRLILSTKLFRKYRHRQAKAVFRKPILLPVQESSNSEQETVPPVEQVSTPAFHWSPQLETLMQTATNQIQMLAEHLLVQLNQGMKTICFKSVFPGDGCSTILLCAVKALLDRHYRILLIDTHRQHIDLPKQLNLQENVNIGNGVITLNESLGLWVWQESNTHEENQAALSMILDTHKEEYDLILLDNGSVTESPLSVLVDFWNRTAIDGVLLIANTKRTSEVPVSHIAGRLRQHAIHLIGIAENYV